MTFKIPNLAMMALSAALAVFLVMPSQAATLSTGYLVGAGSQLLTTNGGSGDTLFFDSAATGGENDLNIGSGFATFSTVFLSGSGLWEIGDTVSITGVALAIRNNTAGGTFTFDIREAAGGGGATGGGGLDSLGTATASYSNTATLAHYVNFDTPITFVADANSTSIGVNIANTGTLGLKTWNNNTPGDRLLQYNYGNGNTPNKYIKFSIAGSVVSIPEPSTLLMGIMSLVGIVATRRR